MLQRGIYLVESMFWKRRQIAVVNIRCPLKAKRCTYKYNVLSNTLLHVVALFLGQTRMSIEYFKHIKT